jgi:methylphosphotriester-DNA--protein-cysteine methyltransferase
VKTYTLLDQAGRPYQSPIPGTFGGHRGTKVYGRLDCPTALRLIAKGHYVQHRVFFADEEAAVTAGYRPCGHCLRSQYRQWVVDRHPARN